MDINTNDHCEFCYAEIDVNNKDNQGQIICTNCGKIHNNF